MHRLAAAIALAFVSIAPLAGHDVARSEARIEAQGREVHLALTLNLTELRQPQLPLDSSGRITIAQLDSAAPAIFEAIKSHYTIQAPGPPQTIAQGNHILIDGHVVRMDLAYHFTHDVDAFTITSRLYDVMAPGHQHLLVAILNGTPHETILTASNRTATFSGVQATKLETTGKFIRLGIEHIVTGYDHLAFLLGLLVAAATVGSLVKIITSFTIAHSITLALATFNLVALPTRLTESVIALSILYVALENLLGFRIAKRYYVTFLFGLVHGFGFSNVLRDMQLPRASLALSLLSFNLGVEIGQITFVLLLFPLFRDLTRSGWRYLQPAVSAGIGCLAVFWFFERAF
jgi:hydrogenase/urease accessory protein HupE